MPFNLSTITELIPMAALLPGQRAFVVLLMLLSLSLSVTADAVPPPDAEAIVRQHVAAIGGQARWQQVRSLLVKGQGSFGTFLWVWKTPDRMRSDEHDDVYSKKTLVTAFDGTAGWISDPFKGPGVPRKFEGPELQRWKTGFPLRSDLLDLPAQGVTLQLLGTEKVNNRPAHKLSLKRPGRDEVLLWIDAQSFLLVQRARRLKTPQGGAETTVETPLGDYRNVSGVMIAHKIGDTRCVVQVNPEVSDSMFLPPAPIQ